MWFQLTVPADAADVAAVLDLVGAAGPRCGGVLVIGIDGPSGAGKTTLAKGVADALGCPVVHMDELFPGWDGLAAAAGLLADQVLRPLSRGEDARYRLWDWEKDRWGGTRELLWTSMLLVEGCAATVGPAAEFIAVPVWVEAAQEIRMERGLERDGEAYRPHWERWAAQERALYAADATRERAALIVRT